MLGCRNYVELSKYPPRMTSSKYDDSPPGDDEKTPAESHSWYKTDTEQTGTKLQRHIVNKKAVLSQGDRTVIGLHVDSGNSSKILGYSPQRLRVDCRS